MDTKTLLRQRFDEAKAEKAALEAAAAPLRGRLDAAAAEFEQARLKWEKAKEELLPQILAIERPDDPEKPHIVKLSEEIATLAAALGGRRMHDGRGGA
jgi:uncharacterized protein YhaN